MMSNAADEGSGDSVILVSRIIGFQTFLKLKMILDVPLKVSVELGRTKMS